MNLNIYQPLSRYRNAFLQKLFLSSLIYRFSFLLHLSGLLLANRATAQTNCIQVTGSCVNMETGQYASSGTIDGKLYFYSSTGESNIGYSSSDGWWYISGADGNIAYNNSTADLPPTSGWVYSGEVCGAEGAPTDITVKVGECLSVGPCYVVTTGCSTTDIGGTYRNIGQTYNGKPDIYDEDGNDIFWAATSWVMYSPTLGSLFENFSTADSPPVDGWVPTENAECAGYSITVALNPVLTPTVSIAANPSGTIINGTNVIFTATSTNGGTTPTYVWKKNDVVIAGVSGATYTTTALANGDKIKVVLTSNAACASPTIVTSNEITAVTTPCIPPVPFAKIWYQHQGPKTISDLYQSGILAGGIAYGAGLFVSVGGGGNNGDNGFLYTSPDGVNWTLRTVPGTPAGLFRVAFANGKFVAVGNSGRILTSTDGINWEDHSVSVASSADYTNLRIVEFGNGLWVVANYKEIFTSTDASTWTKVASSGVATGIRAIVYGNGTFVLAGGFSQVLTSTNGTVWTQTRPDQFPIFKSFDLAFAQGLFVGVGHAGLIETSPDGINWTERAPASGNEDNALYTVKYLNGEFIASGYVSPGKVYTSANGICWTEKLTGFPLGFSSIAYNNGVYVASRLNGGLFSTGCHTPEDFTLTGSNTCAEGLGASIGLASSEIGYQYQLQLNGGNVGSPVAGTSLPLDFGKKNQIGVYTVVATSLTGGCTKAMGNSITLTSGATPSVASVSAACVGSSVNLSATALVGSINWYNAATNGTLLGNSASGANFPVIPAGSTTYYAQINGLTIGSQEFSFTGGLQTFTVPEGVTKINVVAKGAAGGIGSYKNPAGQGGIVTTVLTVTPGQVLNIAVGGTPTGTYFEIGGYNGGGNSYYYGGGGGASDIRTNGTALTNRVVVAGGGGGAGYDGTAGGDGGGLTGEKGDDDTSYPDDAKGGDGGSQTAGGGGGHGYSANGSAGALGIGGNGAVYEYNGGGGGGGYYGGGGGGEYIGYSGGGGGGSNFADPMLCTNVVHNQGGNTGNGFVLISWGDGCISSNRVAVNVTVNPPPTAYTVTGGGAYCAGGSGGTVGLSNSEIGVSYQLKKDNVNAGSAVAGTGAAINFGIQTAAGSYTVVASRILGGCTSSMTGSANVVSNVKPTITLSVNGQSFNEGNTATLCDTDSNPANGVLSNVTTGCVSGTVLWRTQVGAGAWSDWSVNAPSSQLSNNAAYKYQAACDADCPSTLSGIITLTLNYRASTPQNVSLIADGTTVKAGESKTICNLENTLTFNATCASGEILLYSVDGGEYSVTVPTQILDANFHNYRVRCRKADATASCTETESAVMSLKITTPSAAPVVSITPASGCGTPTVFSGNSTCGTLVTVWYNATTNLALPTLPTTTPNATTSYYARCQNEAGCEGEKSNVVTFTLTPVNDAPVVTVSAELVCAGTEVRVWTNCPAGTSVLWNTGVSEASFKVAFNNVTKAAYSAKCITANGCQSPVSAAKTVSWKGFELTFINVGQSKSATKSDDKAAWSSQFIIPDAGPVLDYSTEANPTIYYSENVNKTAPRFWTIHAETCNLGTDGSLTFNMLATPELGVIRSYNTHENNAPYFMYANRAGFTELYAQNHPAYGFFADNGNGGNVYDEGLPKGLYKLGVRYWDQKGQGSIYPSTRQPAGSVLAYQEYWFRIQSKNGIGTGSARVAATTDNGAFAQVMPNPVTNTLHLKVNEAKGQKVNVTLLDASGRALLQRSFVPQTNQHQEEFEVSQLSNGMYFLKVTTADQQTTLKVIKVE